MTKVDSSSAREIAPEDIEELISFLEKNTQYYKASLVRGMVYALSDKWKGLRAIVEQAERRGVIRGLRMAAEDYVKHLGMDAAARTMSGYFNMLHVQADKLEKETGE